MANNNNTLKYWVVARAWHQSKHREQKMTVETAIRLLREIIQEEPGSRLGMRASTLQQTIVIKQIPNQRNKAG